MNKKICLSFTSFHQELWQPAWGIRLILEALISFFPAPSDGAIGSLNWSKEERRKLAKKSQEYVCPRCGPIAKLLPEKSEVNESNTGKAAFTDEIAKLHMYQNMHHNLETNSDDEAVEQASLSGNEVSNESVTVNDDEKSSGVNESNKAPTDFQVQDNDEAVTNDGDEVGNDISFSESQAVYEENNSEFHEQTKDMKAATGDDGDASSRQRVSESNISASDAVVEDVATETQMFDAMIPSWLTDPILDVMLILTLIIVIMLIQKIHELTKELDEVGMS